MSRDKRKKMCPNEHCDMNKRERIFGVEDEYCTVCQTKLVLVCARCHTRIADQEPAHRYCAICEQKIHNRTPKPIRTIKKGFKTANRLGEVTAKKLRNTKLTVGKARQAVKQVAEEHELKEKATDVGVDALKNVGAFAVKEAENAAKSAIKSKIRRK